MWPRWLLLSVFAGWKATGRHQIFSIALSDLLTNEASTFGALVFFNVTVVTQVWQNATSIAYVMMEWL